MLEQGTDLVDVENLDGKLYTTNAIESLHESTKISVTFAWSTLWYKFNRWLTQLILAGAMDRPGLTSMCASLAIGSRRTSRVNV
jgi:hypothetical protein